MASFLTVLASIWAAALLLAGAACAWAVIADRRMRARVVVAFGVALAVGVALLAAWPSGWTVFSQGWGFEGL